MEKKTWSEIVAQYKTLSESDKETVTHFFNMHNFCAWLYDCMSPEAKQYTEACIQASTTKDVEEDPEFVNFSDAILNVDNVQPLNV